MTQLRSRACAAALVLLSALFAGCSDTNELEEELAADTGLLRIIHLIPELQRLQATLGTRELSDFDFQEAGGLSVASGATEALRLSLAPLNLEEDPVPFLNLQVTTTIGVDTNIVLTGTFDSPEVFTWDLPDRDWVAEFEADPALIVFEVSFGHAVVGAGPVDIFIGEPGFDPAAEVPVATLAFGEVADYTERDAALIEFVVTPVGDTSTEIFRSTEILPNPASSLLYVIGETGGVTTGAASVIVVADGIRSVVASQNQPTRLRLSHTAPDTGAVDVWVGEDATEPLFTNLAFGETSDYLDSTQGTDIPVTVYPTGDTAVVIAESTQNLASGLELTLFVSGAAGAEVIQRGVDSNRRVRGEGRLRLIHGAVTVNNPLDLHIVPPGTIPDPTQPLAGTILVNSITNYFDIAEGTYDLYLNAFDTETVLGGPFQIDVQSNGVYGLFTHDNPDGATLGVVSYADTLLIDAGE